VSEEPIHTEGVMQAEAQSAESLLQQLASLEQKLANRDLIIERVLIHLGASTSKSDQEFREHIVKHLGILKEVEGKGATKSIRLSDFVTVGEGAKDSFLCLLVGALICCYALIFFFFFYADAFGAPQSGVFTKEGGRYHLVEPKETITFSPPVDLRPLWLRALRSLRPWVATSQGTKLQYNDELNLYELDGAIGVGIRGKVEF
jgi:hypothetical protein